MKSIKNFFRVFDHQTVIVTLLAVGATFFCRRFGLQAEIPTGLIGLAVVFPIVFSINAAYRRREEALRYLASLKAHAVALYYAHRDWAPEGRAEHARRAEGLVASLLRAVREYFVVGQGKDEKYFQAVYGVFSRFSASHEELRQAGVPANEISRANQYVRAMMIEFERMRNILTYRTPLSLRAYSSVFLNVFPILFGPYFAYLSAKYYPGVGYLVAVLYSLVLVTLDNIQEDLENPYDEVGADDVQLDVAGQYEAVMID